MKKNTYIFPVELSITQIRFLTPSNGKVKIEFVSCEKKKHELKISP